MHDGALAIRFTIAILVVGMCALASAVVPDSPAPESCSPPRPHTEEYVVREMLREVAELRSEVDDLTSTIDKVFPGCREIMAAGDRGPNGEDGCSAVASAIVAPPGDETSSAIFFPSHNEIAFSTNGVERMRISADGKVGIGTSAPEVSLDIRATDAIIIPVGTTAQRPEQPEGGMIRYNSDNHAIEYYNDHAQLWITLPSTPMPP